MGTGVNGLSVKYVYVYVFAYVCVCVYVCMYVCMCVCECAVVFDGLMLHQDARTGLTQRGLRVPTTPYTHTHAYTHTPYTLMHRPSEARTPLIVIHIRQLSVVRIRVRVRATARVRVGVGIRVSGYGYGYG